VKSQESKEREGDSKRERRTRVGVKEREPERPKAQESKGSDLT